MAAKKGSLSISSENIFPIIKKWVYSDHDIFARELVSNGCDAITKLKKLDMMGEYQLPDDYKPAIKVEVNPEEKTLKFTDNGLGMTADEVEEYITQIAFSGATQFLEKYKDKTTEDDMIGHFGLGFYSAFMVADEVHIDTLSYKEGAKPVHWVSNGGTEYEMEEGDKQEVGSTMTLYLNEDSLEFANEYRMREVLEKYCSFMPVEIFLSKANAEPEYETIDEADLKDDDEVIEHIHEDAKMEEKENERIDLVIFLNGIAIITIELKSNQSGQNFENAIEQYKNDRDFNTRLLSFKTGALVHFAMDTKEVYMCTKLSGKSSYFLPFNKGNEEGGKGNPHVDGKLNVYYMWEDILTKDMLLYLIKNFIFVEKEEKEDPKTGVMKLKENLIFPRYHQLDAIRKLVDDIKINTTAKNYLIEQKR